MNKNSLPLTLTPQTTLSPVANLPIRYPLLHPRQKLHPPPTAAHLTATALRMVSPTANRPIDSPLLRLLIVTLIHSTATSPPLSAIQPLAVFNELPLSRSPPSKSPGFPPSLVA